MDVEDGAKHSLMEMLKQSEADNPGPWAIEEGSKSNCPINNDDHGIVF